jgi:hypothetical protein
MGLDCGVAAASSLARSSGERLGKTDAGDARALPGDICSPFARVSRSWVPSEEAERARDLRRLWRASVADAAAARQAVASFPLGRGEAWSQRTPSGSLRATWGRAYGAFGKILTAKIARHSREGRWRLATKTKILQSMP